MYIRACFDCCGAETSCRLKDVLSRCRLGVFFYSEHGGYIQVHSNPVSYRGWRYYPQATNNIAKLEYRT
ncbi:hypothetical protein R1flu_017577 [Riccia fluitans]|uniref:Uncharacterized protein n=1 Tax=Riccia fluitans TaxID=41844 RepID=A0ABD1ZGR7_9MARC